MGGAKNVTDLKQHAIVEKMTDESMFFHFLFPFVMFWLQFKVCGDDPRVL